VEKGKLDYKGGRKAWSPLPPPVLTKKKEKKLVQSPAKEKRTTIPKVPRQLLITDKKTGMT